MKFGIKKKLLSTYILAIVIPIIVMVCLFIFVNIYLNNNEDLDTTDSVNGIVNASVNRVYDHFDSIDDYDFFYEQAMGELKGKNNQIVIVDLQGNRLFDSSNKEASNLHSPYTLADQQYYDVHYTNKDQETIRVIVPLISQEKMVGTAELTLDRMQLDDTVIQKVITIIVITIAVGVIVLIFLILLFTSSVSKGVMEPLYMLSEAAREITNGNLDNQIVYIKNNEFGEFSQIFNTMRIKLKESLEKQQELELARTQLMASVSHDLRTPITSIKGYVEAIQDGKAKSDEKMQQYLDIIAKKTDKLDHMIDDLFQFSQLELKHIKMNMELINSKDLLEKLNTEYTLHFENSPIRFILEAPIPSVDIKMDISMVERVFENILENAKRYIKKDDGEIRVKGHVEKDRLKIAIIDNGEGIKSEDLPHIFNRFYRGEKSRSRDYGGAGLGLSICKEIIERHQGKIWVESTYGRGSTFYIDFPIHPLSIEGNTNIE